MQGWKFNFEKKWKIIRCTSRYKPIESWRRRIWKLQSLQTVPSIQFKSHRWIKKRTQKKWFHVAAKITKQYLHHKTGIEHKTRMSFPLHFTWYAWKYVERECMENVNKFIILMSERRKNKKNKFFHQSFYSFLTIENAFPLSLLGKLNGSSLAMLISFWYLNWI